MVVSLNLRRQAITLGLFAALSVVTQKRVRIRHEATYMKRMDIIHSNAIIVAMSRP